MFSSASGYTAPTDNSSSFQDLSGISAGIPLHLSKHMLGPLRYSLKYVNTQPLGGTCQPYKYPDVGT